MKTTIHGLCVLLPLAAVGCTTCDPVPDDGFGDVGASPAVETSFELLEDSQFAVWLESEDGDLRTLFATCAGANRSWKGGTDRPEALPAWYAARADEEGAGGAPEIDAISGATPAGGGFTAWARRPDGWEGPMTLRVEVNSSFDTNDTWTDRVDGQPAIVWGVELVAGDDAEGPVELELLGRSELSGAIDADVDGIDTALDLATDVTAQWHTE